MSLMSHTDGLSGYAGSMTLGNQDMLVDLLNSNFNFSTLGGWSYTLLLMHLILFKLWITHECWGAEDETMLNANATVAAK